MFSKKQFENFRSDVEVALKGLEQKYNVEIKGGKIRYDEVQFTLELDVRKKAFRGVPFEKMLFNERCAQFGFTPDDYMKEFFLHDKFWRLVGFNPRASKYQVVAMDDAGKRYVFVLNDVKGAIKNAKLV